MDLALESADLVEEREWLDDAVTGEVLGLQRVADRFRVGEDEVGDVAVRVWYARYAQEAHILCE